MDDVLLTSLDELEAFARRIAPRFQPGDVVELIGEMGAGKTTFVGAVVRAFGSSEPARSPTYTVAHAYALANGGVVSHLDCYRSEGATLDAHAWGDVEPYFGPDAIAFVEWPEPIRPWLSQREVWQLTFRIVDAHTRAVRVRTPHNALR